MTATLAAVFVSSLLGSLHCVAMCGPLIGLSAGAHTLRLALVHSLSSISLAQLGRFDEAMTALQQAERLAERVRADDVVATVCGNQANVHMFEHRYDQAVALAERSVALH